MSPSNNEPLATSPEQPAAGAAQQPTGAVPRATSVQVPPVQEPATAQSAAASTVPAAPAANVAASEPSEGMPSADASSQAEPSAEQAVEQPVPTDEESGADQPPETERPHVSAKNTTRVSASAQIPDPIKKAKRNRLIKRVGIAVVSLLIVAVIGIAAFSVWTIWYRFDDRADIQGTWVNSEGVAVTFDASQMHLQSGVTFDYTLNPETKEIDYSFSRSSGHGVYRFAQDRQVLIIDEKGKTDWLLVLEAKEDPALQGALPDGVTVFRRAS